MLSSSLPLPRVLVNMAITADGKIATADRGLSSFGSPQDIENLFALRATVDAVFSGARTVDADDVDLGPGPRRFRRRRVRSGLAEYNLRVVASGAGTVNPRARIFRRRFSPVLILTTARASAARQRRLRELADEVAVFGGEELDLRSALAWLRGRWQVRRLLCEGGGELNDAMFRAGLVSELHVTVCPKICGGSLAPTLADGLGRLRLRDATRCRLRSMNRVGDEVYLVYDVAG